MEELSALYRYSNGTWTFYWYYQTDDGIDIFDDNFQVDDCLYFINNGYPSTKSHGHKYTGLRVVVDTPVQADTYNYTWEYYDKDGTWKPLPSINDPSNGLSVSGTHDITWDVPYTWKESSRINSYWNASGFTVRLRVTDVSNPTEGGTFGTSSVIQQYTYAYTINDGGTYDIEDIYSLDSTLGNGLVTKTSDSVYYKVMANVLINDGTLELPYNTHTIVGDLTNSYNTYGGYEILIRPSGTLTMNTATLEWHTSYFAGQYNYWRGTWQMYNASRFVKTFGGYVSQTIASVLDIEDSQWETIYPTDTIYVHKDARGTVTRTNIVVYNLYIYSGNITWSDVQMKKTGNVTTNHYLLGGSNTFYAMFYNPDFRGEITWYVTQGQEFWAINPLNLDPDKIALGVTYGSYSNVAVVAYELDMRVVDESNNPIEGARVEIRDTNGKTALLHDRFRTGGWTIYNLTSDTDTVGQIRKYSSDRTTYTYTKPDFLDTGDYFRVRGEYMSVQSITSSGVITVSRNQTYNGDPSRNYPCRYGIAPIYTIHEYVNTRSDGTILWEGDQSSYTPLIITDMYYEDKNDNQGEVHYNPFTISVYKPGYKPYTISLTIDQPTSLLIKMERSSINVDSEVL